MNFIYDLLLNFNQNHYEFYEWNEDDNYSFVKRIPVFKSTIKMIDHIKNKHLKLEKDFINLIKNKTEIIDNGLVKILDYACLFSSPKETVAVVFDSEGNKILSSSLLIDEEIDTINKTRKLPTIKLDYKIKDKERHNHFRTRKESSIVDLLIKELDKLYKERNYDKIKYLYYECFFKLIDNIDIMYSELLDMITSKFSNNHMRLYNIIKLSISS